MSRPASGHIYFDLKDERSVLACIIWRNTKNVESEFIKEGLEVSAVGKLTTFSGQILKFGNPDQKLKATIKN